MPDSKMALPTRRNIDRHRKPEMSATEPEVETGSGNSTRTESVSEAIPTATPHFRLCPTQKMALPTRPTSETRNVGHGTGSGNRK